MSQAAAPIAPDVSTAVTLRSATREELHETIEPSWIASYSHRLPAKMLRADTPRGYGRQRYWRAMEGRVRRLIAVPDVTVTVADVEGMLAGWSCEDKKNRILHYVYVRDTFRRQGIARTLCGWIEDASKGLVVLAAMPPQWFTDQKAHEQDPLAAPWKPHQVIDICTPY